MAQFVKKDEEKIKDCKEDVDTRECSAFNGLFWLSITIHVYAKAGLFSAILSAFLVATYPDL